MLSWLSPERIVEFLIQPQSNDFEVYLTILTKTRENGASYIILPDVF